jgi:Holliday junction resolvase YEN1
VFVIDGPRRPKKRNLNIRCRNNDDETELLREMLENLGVPWHRAPAEAEAECAKLQKLGIVDAVWTEDSEALMFGATTVLRFSFKPKGGKPQKDNLKIRVYRSEDILAKYPYLDREGLVLFAVLSGADYNTIGLPNVAPEGTLEVAKQGLGHTLCQASRNGNLGAWREQLQTALTDSGSKVRFPQMFPNADHVKYYNRPIVSETETLRTARREWWSMPFDQDVLWPFLLRRSSLWLPDYFQLIVPIVLIKSLAQTLPGQEASNGCYEVQYLTKDGPLHSKIFYKPSVVMPLDISTMSKEEPDGFTKDGIRPPETVECDQILTSILRHGIPQAMVSVDSTKKQTLSRPDEQLKPGKKRGRPPKKSVDGTNCR